MVARNNIIKVKIKTMKNNNPFVPLLRKAKIYPNADTDKLQILLDNQGKSGVYR
jgi:hypothetical protein